MIADLKPYPEYKESGLWLGDLPAHWQTRRAKYFFREIDERSVTGKEVLLSVSHLTGVTPRSEKTISMFLAKSNVGHKLCRPDDVVINTLMQLLLKDDTQVYKQFVENASFRRFVSDMVYALTND